MVLRDRSPGSLTVWIRLTRGFRHLIVTRRALPIALELLACPFPGLLLNDGGGRNRNPFLLRPPHPPTLRLLGECCTREVTTLGFGLLAPVVVVCPSVDRVAQQVGHIAPGPPRVPVPGTNARLIQALGNLIRGELFVHQPLKPLSHHLGFGFL